MLSVHLEDLGKDILRGISGGEAIIVRAGGTPPTKHLLLVPLFVNLIDNLYHHEFFTKGASTYPGDTAPSAQTTFLLLSTLHMHTWTHNAPHTLYSSRCMLPLPPICHLHFKYFYVTIPGLLK